MEDPEREVAELYREEGRREERKDIEKEIRRIAFETDSMTRSQYLRSYEE